LPSNSSVNTVQPATIEEAVLHVRGDVTQWVVTWCVSVPRLYKWQNSFGWGTSQFSVGERHGKFVLEEEYKKSTCEDLTCDLKTLCMLQHSDIGSVWFSETFIVPLL
jgi:hypothetical protein